MLTFLAGTASSRSAEVENLRMFHLCNGAIKVESEGVFMHLGVLGGGRECSHDLYEDRDTGQKEELNCYLTIFKQTIKSY